MNGDLTTWLKCANEPRLGRLEGLHPADPAAAVNPMVTPPALRRVHRSSGTIDEAIRPTATFRLSAPPFTLVYGCLKTLVILPLFAIFRVGDRSVPRRASRGTPISVKGSEPNFIVFGDRKVEWHVQRKIAIFKLRVLFTMFWTLVFTALEETFAPRRVQRFSRAQVSAPPPAAAPRPQGREECAAPSQIEGRQLNGRDRSGLTKRLRVPGKWGCRQKRRQA